MNSKILVIGGAGFIGSHFVDTCLENGNLVTVFDNFASGKREFLPDNLNLRIVEGDILNRTQIENCLNEFKPDWVFHLAAIHFIPTCEERPDYAIRLNIEGTQNVLSACKGKNIKLVFTSTGAIYDPLITDALSEESNIKTGDIYGITKLTGEELVKYYITKHQETAIIVRLFNAVGMRETNPHLIPAVMEQLGNGARKIELGNLYPKRDYIHVKDIAEGLFSITKSKNVKSSDVLNLGSGVEYTVEKLVELCGEVMGEAIEIESVAERRRAFDRKNQLANIEKMKSVCGWEPKRTLRQALEEVWVNEILPIK